MKAIALSLAAVAILTVAGQSHRWFTHEASYPIGFGLVAHESCPLAVCETTCNVEMIAEAAKNRDVFGWGYATQAFSVLGYVTLAGIIIGIAGLVAAAGLAAFNRRLRARWAPTAAAQVAFVVAIGGALGMSWTRPSMPPWLVWEIGPAWWLFLGGALLGVIAARLLRHHVQLGLGVELPPARRVTR